MSNYKQCPYCGEDKNTVMDKFNWKYKSYLLIGIILCVSVSWGCSGDDKSKVDAWMEKFDDTPKDHNEVRLAALECMELFLDCIREEDFFNDPWKSRDGQAFKLCVVNAMRWKILDAIYYRDLKFEEQETSISHVVEEVRKGNRLNYVKVKVKYKKRTIYFKICFGGETGTEGVPRILSTIGLYRFNNDKLMSTEGIKLNFEKDGDDYAPTELYSEAISAASFVKKYNKVKGKDVNIESVTIDKNWDFDTSWSEEHYNAPKQFEVYCSDKTKFIIESEHKFDEYGYTDNNTFKHQIIDIVKL